MDSSGTSCGLSYQQVAPVITLVAAIKVALRSESLDYGIELTSVGHDDGEIQDGLGDETGDRGAADMLDGL